MVAMPAVWTPSGVLSRRHTNVKLDVLLQCPELLISLTSSGISGSVECLVVGTHRHQQSLRHPLVTCLHLAARGHLGRC